MNTEGETERGLDSQHVTVTGYITKDPETTGKLHQINPQIQTKKYCDDKFTNSRSGIGDEQAIDDSIPRNFTPTLMCATVQVVKSNY